MLTVAVERLANEIADSDAWVDGCNGILSICQGRVCGRSNGRIIHCRKINIAGNGGTINSPIIDDKADGTRCERGFCIGISNGTQCGLIIGNTRTTS